METAKKALADQRNEFEAENVSHKETVSAAEEKIRNLEAEIEKLSASHKNHENRQREAEALGDENANRLEASQQRIDELSVALEKARAEVKVRLHIFAFSIFDFADVQSSQDLQAAKASDLAAAQSAHAAALSVAKASAQAELDGLRQQLDNAQKEKTDLSRQLEQNIQDSEAKAQAAQKELEVGREPKSGQTAITHISYTSRP